MRLFSARLLTLYDFTHMQRNHLFFPIDDKQIAKAQNNRKQDTGDWPYEPRDFPSIRQKAPSKIYSGCD